MTETTLPDAALVRAVLAGEKRRFDELVTRHLPAVYSVLLARTHNHADAEELAQETFLRAYLALPRLRDASRFEGWLITIARNFSRRFWRRRHRETAVLSRQAAREAAAPVDVAQQEREAMLMAHLHRLREKHAEVLLLHYFAGKSTTEMAHTLDCKPEAVKKRLQRAREALGRELLESLGEEARQPRRHFEQQAKAIAATLAAAGTMGRGAAVAAVMPPWLLKGALPLATAGAIVLGGLTLFKADGKAPAMPGQQAGNTPAAATPLDPSVSGGAAQPFTPVLPPETEPVDPAGAAEVEEALAESHDAAPPAPASSPGHLEHALQALVNIEFERIHLSEILNFIGNRWELTLLLDPRAVPPGEAPPQAQPPDYVTDGMLAELDLRDVPLSEALEEMLFPLGLGYAPEPGYIWISSAERLRREWRRKPEAAYQKYDTDAQLSTSVSLVFQDIHLSEVLNFAQNTWDINVVLDYRSVAPHLPEWEAHLPSPPGSSNGSSDGFGASGFAQPLPEDFEFGQFPPAPMNVHVGMVPSITLQDIALSDALEALLRGMDLVHSVENGFLWVRHKTHPRPVQLDAALPEVSATTRAALARPCQVAFREVPLAQALELLRALPDMNGIAFEVAPELEERQVPRFTARQLSLESVLRILAATTNLHLEAEGDTIHFVRGA